MAKTKDYKVTITDQQNEYTFSAKKKNAIYVKGIKQDDIDTNSFKIDGDNLLFSAKGKDFVVSNYTGIKYIKTDNALGKTELLDIISHSYVDNTDNEIKNLVKPYYNSKKLSVSGTNYNDVIDLSESGYQPTGSKNIRNNKGITINGGNGDDEITGTIYNDNITGAAGANVINYSKGFGHDVVNLAKGENLTLKFDNTLSLDDLKFEYTNKNKDLKISYNNNEGSITLKNFASKNVTNNANAKKNLADSSSVELIIDSITYDLRSNQTDGEYWYEIKPTGNFTGGWLNDHINAKNADEIKNRKNNHVDLVLKGGAGDDLIESSMTADKITGGAGHNIIKYTSLEQLKGDKVYLTKGEKLDIDISEMAGATATYRVTKNDLVVTVEYNEQKEDFTIINFGTKDVTNNKTKKIDDTSNVKLITATEPDGIDLRQDIEVSTNTGTYHNDNIDRSDYDVWEDRKKTVRSTNWNKTGLTIKGGAGNDTITGSKYSDTIYGNTGSDTINAGTGNNYIYLNKGDGNDIIENGGGVDTLVFAKKTNLSYEYDKYDLIVKYSDNDSVTLKDYFKGHSVQYVQVGSTKTLFNPQRPQFNEYNEDGYHVIEGTVIADTIVGTNNNDKIFGNDDDDNIDGKKGSDILDGGAGINTYSFTSGDGNDVIVSGAGTDTIEFDREYVLSYSRYLNGNNLIINYGDNDSVTLQDYFVNNSHSTSTILNGTKELNISEEVEKGYSVIGTNSAETFDGTVNVPFTYVVNGGTDLIQNSKNTDTIKLDTQETISYSKASNSDDLVITYGDNKVTVKDYFNTDNHVQRIVNRTTTLDIAEELENKLEITIPENETSITGTTNNDTIYLRDHGITFFVSEGDGKDTVYSGTSEDTLVFSDKAFDDLSYKKQNNDLVISYSVNDSVTLKNYFTETHSVKNITAGGNTELLSDKIKLYFNGSNNAETIIGTDYDDIITSNKGNDTVNGGKGNNTYIFVSGDGKDTIVNGQGNDTIRFNSKLDLRFSHNLQNNDLVLAYSNNDTITLQNYYVNNSHSVQTIQNGTETLTIEEALNTYGIDITGTSSSENISGTLVNDTIIGGRGSDEINGGSGNNTYIFNTGDGADTIINGTGTDTIKFNEKMNLSYYHLGNNLKIRYGDSDSIILEGFCVKNSHSVKTIINGDETIELSSIIGDIIGINTTYSLEGTNYKDIISNQKSNSSKTINAKDGNDIIMNQGLIDVIDCGNGNDKVDSYSQSNTINGGAGNDIINNYSRSNTINGDDGDDTITSVGASYINGGDGNDIIINRAPGNGPDITGGSGDDTITNDGYAKNIYGNSGNDTITINHIINGSVHGNEGNDTIIVNSIDSDTNIVNSVYGDDGDDNITLNGRVYDVFGGSGNDVIETGNNSRSEYIYGDDGDDIINASGSDSGIFRIDGGVGNDIITVGSSVIQCPNIYFGDNFGYDTLYLRYKGSRKLYLNCDNSNDLHYKWQGDDFVISYNNNSLTLKDFYFQIDKSGYYTKLYYGSPKHYSNYIDLNNVAKFIDRTNTSNIINGSLYGTTENDSIVVGYNTTIKGSIFGEDGNDHITLNSNVTVEGSVYGGKGDDHIYSMGTVSGYICGGDGNDTINIDHVLGGTETGIYGGKGNDVINGSQANVMNIYFDKEDGHDTIYRTAFSTNLYFSDDSGPRWYHWSDNDLVIIYNTDSVTIKDYGDVIYNPNVAINVNDVNLRNLAPKRSKALTMSLGASNSSINEITAQVVAFTSANDSDVAVSYNTPDTNGILLVMSEYTNTDLQGNI